MHSSLIGKIEKARLYAQERDRVHFERLAVTFRGENDVHHVELDERGWRCSCDFFRGWGVCSHTMALEKILEGMVPPVQVPDAARATA